MSLKTIRVVLVEPLYGGNVGSVCRAMANMGLEALVLVNPRGIDPEEARRMACHADGVWMRRREVATLEEAVAECVAVAGTTARGGLYRRHVRTPREWAPELLERSASGPVALVFGREDNGLQNEEIAVCTHLIRIPSSPSYLSLNLAQAVMVCLYELYLAGETYEPPTEKSEAAAAAFRERMFEMWRQMLLEAGFMEPAKADHMMQGIRRILSRGAITRDDVNIMMGVARQVSWAMGRSERG